MSKTVGPVVDDIKAAGGDAMAMLTDVRSEIEIHDMVAQCIGAYGKVDILVNNAAIGSNIPPIPVLEMSADTWDDLMAVNVRGPFFVREGRSAALCGPRSMARSSMSARPP